MARLTVFRGRAGDHNDLAMSGAASIGRAMHNITGTAPVVVGAPEPALNVGWRRELDAAMPALRAMQMRVDAVLADRGTSIAALSRCAVSMATLPAVARHAPSSCIVWFDAHADLNTPASTTTGYLGGLALAGPLGLWETGLGAGLDARQVVLVGQRDLDPFERDLISRLGIAHVTPGEDLVARLRHAIDGRPVYVHLDCDVLEPGIVPTDYAHAGGLTLDDLHDCCRVIVSNAIIGLEIAEFQDAWEPGGEPVSPMPLQDAVTTLLIGSRLI